MEVLPFRQSFQWAQAEGISAGSVQVPLLDHIDQPLTGIAHRLLRPEAECRVGRGQGRNPFHKVRPVRDLLREVVEHGVVGHI